MKTYNNIARQLGLNKLTVLGIALLAALAISFINLKPANAFSNPPETYIGASIAQDSTMQLYFTADQSATYTLPKFQCKLDDGPWKGCSTGITWHGLAGTYAKPLSHLIQVRAVSADGQVDPTPSSVIAVTPRTPVGARFMASVSADGCSAWGSGLPGMTLTVEASANGRGGSMDITIPQSGYLPMSGVGTGGVQGMYVTSTLSDSLGNVYATAESMITQPSCPPAGL